MNRERRVFFAWKRIGRSYAYGIALESDVDGSRRFERQGERAFERSVLSGNRVQSDELPLMMDRSRRRVGKTESPGTIRTMMEFYRRRAGCRQVIRNRTERDAGHSELLRRRRMELSRARRYEQGRIRR